MITTSRAGTDDRYEVDAARPRKPGAKPRALIPGFDQQWYATSATRGSTFYFQTNEGAPLAEGGGARCCQGRPITA